MLYVDAMASFWRDWIVSYDTSHQYTLGQAAFSGTRGLLENARKWARDHYASMLKWAQRSQDRVKHSPKRWAILAVAVAATILLLGNLRRVARLVHEKWLRAYPERSPKQAGNVVSPVARALERQGMEKPASQTPQEFLRKIEDTRLRGAVARLPESMNPLALETPPMTLSVCRSYTKK